MHAAALTPALLETAGAPYFQRALVELLLLAVLAGVLGSWIVLRRLAFYTHAVGNGDVPGPGGGGAVGRRSAADGAGGRARLRRRAGAARAHPPHRPRGGDRAAARGRAGGRDRARLRRLRVGRGRGQAAVRVADRPAGARPVADGGRRGARPRRQRRRCGARGWRRGSMPTARAPSACARRAPTAHCWPPSRWRSWSRWTRSVRCSSPSCSSSPPPPCGCSRRDVRTLQLGTGALAAAEGVTALVVADALNVGPGPAMAVLGGLVYGAVALRRASA